MPRVVKPVLVLAAAAAAWLGPLNRAEANFFVRLSTAGAANVDLNVSGTSGSINNITIGAFTIDTLSLSSNLPGTSFGNASESSLTVKLNRALNAGESPILRVDFYSFPFTSPGANGSQMDVTGALTYLDTGPPTAGTTRYQAFAGNNPSATPPAVDVTTNTVSLSAPGALNNNDVLFNRNSSTFMLGGTLNYDFTGKSVGAVMTTTASVTANLVNAVPAPPSAVMLLTGLPLAGLLVYRRFRMALV